jgi:glc operon protein GlcG
MTRLIKALTLAMAQKMADAAETAAREKNLKIAIAIMDAHGNLKYYRRMDDNNFVSVRMSQLKALTSASIPISTKELADRNEKLPNGPFLEYRESSCLRADCPLLPKTVSILARLESAVPTRLLTDSAPKLALTLSKAIWLNI